MFRRTLMGTVAAMVLVAGSVVAQPAPPNSEEAKRVEALVNKAAAFVDAKGRAALSDFRKRGSEWWSGEVYIFAYSPDGTVILNPAFPAREGRAYHGDKIVPLGVV